MTNSSTRPLQTGSGANGSGRASPQAAELAPLGARGTGVIIDARYGVPTVPLMLLPMVVVGGLAAQRITRRTAGRTLD